MASNWQIKILIGLMALCSTSMLLFIGNFLQLATETEMLASFFRRQLYTSCQPKKHYVVSQHEVQSHPLTKEATTPQKIGTVSYLTWRHWLSISVSGSRTYDNYISDPARIKEKVYVDRQRQVGESCPQKKTSISLSKLDHILVDKKHSLLYCYVPKVACTNWKRVFMILSGKSNATNVLEIPANVAHGKDVFERLTHFSMPEVNYMLKTYTKFLFVRHPFERLLSAYRNKLEQHYLSSKYFQARFGRYIIKRYRKNPTNRSLIQGDDVLFQEFAAYLVDENNVVFNEHWKPMHDLCYPCIIHYDIIGKYETLSEDTRYILSHVGESDISFPYSEKQSSTSLNLHKYYQNLTNETIEKLYSIYKADFQLFGYDLESFIVS